MRQLAMDFHKTYTREELGSVIAGKRAEMEAGMGTLSVEAEEAPLEALWSSKRLDFVRGI